IFWLRACKGSPNKCTWTKKAKTPRQVVHGALKGTRKTRAQARKYCSCLQCADLGSLRAFWTVFNFVLDFLAFVKAAVATTFDSRKVCEYICAAVIRGNKTKTLVGVEPFNFARLSHV